MSLAAFDELFKAHFVFSVSYDDALSHMYTFLRLRTESQDHEQELRVSEQCLGVTFVEHCIMHLVH